MDVPSSLKRGDLPTPTPPVRFDRIASRQGDESSGQFVTLVQVGKSTEAAMLVGAVQGYRGLVRELIRELKRELRVKNLPVVATGGYAGLIAAKMPISMRSWMI